MYERVRLGVFYGARRRRRSAGGGKGRYEMGGYEDGYFWFGVGTGRREVGKEKDCGEVKYLEEGGFF